MLDRGRETRFRRRRVVSALGLHSNRFRYYDPVTGRYISADPIGQASGVNVFSYVTSNPLVFVDWLGLKLCKMLVPGLDGNGNLTMVTAIVDDSVAPLVKKFLENNEKSNITVTVSSSFRSDEEQANLSNDPNAITPAPVGHSLHEAGYAIDVNYHSIPKGQRAQVVQNAKDAGLSWGGKFHKPDPVHFYKEVPGGPKSRSKYIADAQKEDLSAIPYCYPGKGSPGSADKDGEGCAAHP